MPALKDVIPDLQTRRELKLTQAYEYRHEQVCAIKLTTGAPCSAHADLFEPWPGEPGNIEKWYVLDNGVAVGLGTDVDGEPYCPVVRLDSSADS